MDIKILRQFLVDSNKAGYAGGEEKKWIKEADGSTSIHFTQGTWHSHDNFFGGEPYGGRIVVFYRNKPIWIMVYYGWVAEKIETNPVYTILRNALINMPENHPFRGPKEYKHGPHIYVNSWQGNVEQFSGEEYIARENKIVYKANYRGGIIDQRAGV